MLKTLFLTHAKLKMHGFQRAHACMLFPHRLCRLHIVEIETCDLFAISSAYCLLFLMLTLTHVIAFSYWP